MRLNLNPQYSCGLDIETASHYFLNCLLFHAERFTRSRNINQIDGTLLNNQSVIPHILPYGNESFKDEVNLLILNASIDSVLSAIIFDEPLSLL